MARTAALPQTPAAGELLARLTSSISRFCDRPWLMEGVSWSGVGLSTVLAGVGVIGLVGFESPLAKIGSGILLAGTVLTEIAAARLPIHAQRRFAEGGWAKASIATLGFMSLTAWNIICGHFGMVAIDRAGVEDVRAPLERQAARADAERETAEEALSVFDAVTRQEQEAMGLALRGAFESGYVSSAARNARATSAEREVRRAPLAQAVATARAGDRAAERALASAPKPRPDHELWGFALVIEILKGALVWFATAGERRNSVLQCNTKFDADPRTLSPAQRRELKSRCASLLATMKHMEAAYG